MKEVVQTKERIEEKRSGIKGLFTRKLDRLKEASYTCPFCKEVLKGLRAMLAHLKVHCT